MVLFLPFLVMHEYGVGSDDNRCIYLFFNLTGLRTGVNTVNSQGQNILNWQNRPLIYLVGSKTYLICSGVGHFFLKIFVVLLEIQKSKLCKFIKFFGYLMLTNLQQKLKTDETITEKITFSVQKQICIWHNVLKKQSFPASGI